MENIFAKFKYNFKGMTYERKKKSDRSYFIVEGVSVSGSSVRPVFLNSPEKSPAKNSPVKNFSKRLPEKLSPIKYSCESPDLFEQPDSIFPQTNEVLDSKLKKPWSCESPDLFEQPNSIFPIRKEVLPTEVSSDSDDDVIPNIDSPSCASSSCTKTTEKRTNNSTDWFSKRKKRMAGKKKQNWKDSKKKKTAKNIEKREKDGDEIYAEYIRNKDFRLIDPFRDENIVTQLECEIDLLTEPSDVTAAQVNYLVRKNLDFFTKIFDGRIDTFRSKRLRNRDEKGLLNVEVPWGFFKQETINLAADLLTEFFHPDSQWKFEMVMKVLLAESMVTLFETIKKISRDKAEEIIERDYLIADKNSFEWN